MNHRLSLNCFLISLALNLTLLLILSICREHATPQSKDAVDVKFVSLPRTRLQRRPLITPPRSFDSSAQHIPSPQINVRIAEEIEPSHPNSTVLMGIPSTDSFAPNSLPVSPQSTVSALTQPRSAGGWERGGGVPSRPTRSGIGRQVGQADGRIVPPQPKAIITGSGDSLSGYYNISLVRYEDTSDVISADALTQLAGAMNGWTEIRTEVIREPMMLDDPELLQVPLVYITSRRPFAFSERERENLRRYFANGGFLLFSNAATSDSDARGVANSIEFELWKVLGGVAHDLVDIGKKHQIPSSPPLEKGAGGIYRSFFDLPDLLGLRGITLDGRIAVIYEDSGYATAWATGKNSKREPYLRLGVNIIVYALTTSPMVQRN